MNFFSGSLFTFITAMIFFHIKYVIFRHHAALIFEEGVFSNKPFLQFLLQLNIFLAGVVVKLGRRLYQQ